MSEQAAGTETGAPAQTQSANTPPATQAGQQTKTPQPADENADWFKERLSRSEEQARQKLLEELGVKDPVKAKKAIEAAAKAEEEAKSVAEKLSDTASKLTRTETEAERLRKVTKEWAARQMLGLSAEQQAAVKDIAGDDATEQLRAITALAPTWAKQTTEATATRPLPTPTPASGTAPPPHAPEGGTQQSPPNPKEVHAALLKTNPFAAAEYGLAHAREVFPEPQQ
jgi:hypothetical protein